MEKLSVELVILGSGSAFTGGARGEAGVLVHHDGTCLLVDAGPGTVGRLGRAGYGPERIDAVFLTHWHPDHISDLVPLLFAMKYASGVRTEDVRVHGPGGFTGIFDGLLALFGQWCVGETYDVVPVELERERVEIGGLTVTAFPVRHSVPAIGYRIEAGGRVIALTGDTGPHVTLTDLARDADLLVADATLPDGTTDDGHLNARQAGEVATAAGAHALVLSHLSPEADAADAVGAARSAFAGPVTKAEDLLAVTL